MVKKSQSSHSFMWLTPDRYGRCNMEGQHLILEDPKATTFFEKCLKLVCEPMPEAQFGINYRSYLGKSGWDKVRRQMLVRYEGKCKFCGGTHRLQCHEVWDYDFGTHKQSLIDLEIVCGMCHFVKHIGLAYKLAHEGKLDIEAVIQHFMSVNGCPLSVFEKHLTFIKVDKMRLNKECWTTDYDAWIVK